MLGSASSIAGSIAAAKSSSSNHNLISTLSPFAVDSELPVCPPCSPASDVDDGVFVFPSFPHATRPVNDNDATNPIDNNFFISMPPIFY